MRNQLIPADKEITYSKYMRPNIDDYIAFFGSSPQWVHEQGWYYGARFSFLSGNDELTVTVAPDEAEMDVCLFRVGRPQLQLSLKMVVEWTIEIPDGVEQLVVRVNTGPMALCGFEYCLIRLRPQIEVDCRMSWGPGWPPGSRPVFRNSLRSDRAEPK